MWMIYIMFFRNVSRRAMAKKQVVQFWSLTINRILHHVIHRKMG
ncbi:hypothetical protein CSC02_2840 [Enterobacter hormaechei subsp. hoffmannii]|nr:hypothetical protein CSC02_2840 [Enterobacter hormaechei subsp. hoffmannii]